MLAHDLVTKSHCGKEPIMKPRVKVGLIAGFLGLGLGFFVYMIIGILFGVFIRFPLELAYPIFGFFYTLLVGAAAGNFAAKKERVLVAGDGARIGAVSGGIAGAIMVIVPLRLCGLGGLVSFMLESGETGPVQYVSVLFASGFGMFLSWGIAFLVAMLLGGAAGGYLRASSLTAEDFPIVE
jgi:hypothetical protein